MLILRFCPDDISKPALSLFESAVTMEGKSDVSLPLSPIPFLLMFSVASPEWLSEHRHRWQ
jgi:hypothetical protein